MKTLAIRMDRHCANAKKIARRLAEHPKVKTVLFPGDPSFSDYELARTQMKNSGGMISFHIDGTKDDVFAFLNELTMIHSLSVLVMLRHSFHTQLPRRTQVSH